MCRIQKYCRDNPCFPGVECKDTTHGYQCGTCPQGHTGDGITCEKLFGCEGKPCYEGVRCFDTFTGFRCGSCPPGYYGDGLKCNLNNHCSENPCWKGVKCFETKKDPGYECGPCPDGFSGNGTICEDLREKKVEKTTLGCKKHEKDYLYYLHQRPVRIK